MIAVGLMSGTSLDGIDAVLVRIEPHAAGYALETLRFSTVPFDEALRPRIVAALPPHTPSPRTVAELDAALGDAFAAATRALVAVAPGGRVDFVASHGLTLYHDGDAALTTQVGDPYRIRDAANATVVCDFRRADCARGGSGAPLVPYVDALLYGGRTECIVAVNIGGIANLTIVDGAAPRAWDTGPGNMLLDAFVAERTAGAQRFDRDGRYGARGTVAVPLLEAMLADPYFHRPPPKSTGRELFGAAFLERFAADFASLALSDGAATLTALTAASIASDVAASVAPGATVVLSGGGARNPALRAALAARLPDYTVRTSDAYRIDADAKEALAFAVLGYETLRGRPASVPAVTGARGAAVLGAIVPVDLAALLARVAAETEMPPRPASKTPA